jgi:hypothetical protein
VIDGTADGFEIETLMNVRALAAGMRVVEVPSYESRRVHGSSNLNTWQDGYRVLRTITRERLYVRAQRRGAPGGRVSNGSPIVEALLPADACRTPTETLLPPANGNGNGNGNGLKEASLDGSR